MQKPIGSYWATKVKSADVILSFHFVVKIAIAMSHKVMLCNTSMVCYGLLSPFSEHFSEIMQQVSKFDFDSS